MTSDILSPGRTRVMGILNVTPDSFSDGGRWLQVEAAVVQGLGLVEAGADIIDVGGESTRPGAPRVDAATELGRVLPVVTALAREGVVVSVDTMRASVAEAVIDAGASIINDVSGGLADPDMCRTVGAAGAIYIAMHWRGHADVMAVNAVYDDVVATVCAELSARADAALAAGISADRLVLDPGIGFAKTFEHNWTLLRHLDAVAALGYPILLGVSRKGFLGEVLSTSAGPRPAAERDAATSAITALAAQQGLWAVRTHTAREHRDIVEVFHKLRQAT